MTPDQERHLQGSFIRFHADYRKKYEAGQKAHGGNLWEKGLKFFARAAREEAVDQIAYTDGINQTVAAIDKLCAEGLDSMTPDYVIRDILRQIRKLLDGTTKPNT